MPVATQRHGGMPVTYSPGGTQKNDKCLICEARGDTVCTCCGATETASFLVGAGQSTQWSFTTHPVFTGGSWSSSVAVSQTCTVTSIDFPNVVVPPGGGGGGGPVDPLPNRYACFEITVVNAAAVTSATDICLDYKVHKRWPVLYNLNPSTIRLQRFVPGTGWTVLPFELTSQDADYYYYCAHTPGFSYFGITAELYNSLPNPGGVPKYFGPAPNWVQSPLPRGLISAINIDVPGAGYTAPPTLKIIDYYYGEVPNPATAVATINAGMVDSVQLTYSGSGYTVPVVLIDGVADQAAEMTAVMDSLGADQISKLIITGPTFESYGYVSAGTTNTVEFTDGSLQPLVLAPPAIMPVAIPIIYDGKIVGIEVTNPGLGVPQDIRATLRTVSGLLDERYVLLAERGGFSGGIKKFVNKLDLAEVPAKMAEPSADPLVAGKYDYYQLAIVEYDWKFHRDLPPTRIRGYVQVDIEQKPGGGSFFSWPKEPLLGGTVTFNGNPVMCKAQPVFGGPILNATSGRPTVIKFYNLLPLNKGHILPVDESAMGAGMDMTVDPPQRFSDNRTVIHLHGNNSAWISDGGPHQWFTPSGETTHRPKGVGALDLPPLPDGTYVPTSENGATILYFTNNLSSRMLFYHDHAYGLTRLNVYAGELSLYDITDPTDADLLNGTNLTGINDQGFVLPKPTLLAIQDRTFIDADAVGFQDPTWNNGTGEKVNGILKNLSTDPLVKKYDYRTGDQWYPHVYVPAQNPYTEDGLNPYGRWHYGPWFWPTPSTAEMTHLPVKNPAYGGTDGSLFVGADGSFEYPLIPDIPKTSMVGEAFMDTMSVNGVAYPYIEIDPSVQRFRILNACGDRFLNLQWYIADPENDNEVKMVPAIAPSSGFWPETWPADAREGGVPDPNLIGPPIIQIGNECGYLPKPVVIPAQPISWITDPTMFAFGNVDAHSLAMGTAERADILVDFTDYAGQTLILYNDAPSAYPAQVGQYTYFTGCPDRMDAGGAPSTLAGYGPNIRTVMKVVVKPLAVAQSVDAVVVVSGGECYTAPIFAVEPTILGPAIIAIEPRCSIDGISVNYPGSNYNMPVIVIDPPTTGGTQATAVAEVDSQHQIKKVTITNPGSGYTMAPSITVTETDPAYVGLDRMDAVLFATLTIDAVVVIDGGSGFTVPPKITVRDSAHDGYGGVGHGAEVRAMIVGPPSLDMMALDHVFEKTVTKRGLFEIGHEPIIVPSPSYNSAYGRTDLPVMPALPAGSVIPANDGYIRQWVSEHIFTDLRGETHTISFAPKSMQDEQGEVFDDYGRGFLMLGLETPFTNAGNQNFISYPFASPPVEVIKSSMVDMSAEIQKIGNGGFQFDNVAHLEDGTQIWRITHNGVDTHTLHLHLVNAQLVNRVAWDGVLFPPDDNELGFKETFKIHPLMHTFIAFRPFFDKSIPFLPVIRNSYRLIGQDMAEGMVLPAPTVTKWTDIDGEPLIDANGNEESMLNHYVNYGFEYMIHCHLLAHEEMDMMHAVAYAVPPSTPTKPNLIEGGNTTNAYIDVTFTPQSLHTTSYVVESSLNFAGPWTVEATIPAPALSYTVSGGNYVFSPAITRRVPTPYTGNTRPHKYIRVKAVNTVGDNTLMIASGPANFPVINAESGYALNYSSNVVLITNIIRTPSYTSIAITWTDSPIPQFLQFQLATNSTYTTGVVNSGVILSSALSYIFAGLLPSTNYYIRVQASMNNPYVWSSWVNLPVTKTLTYVPIAPTITNVTKTATGTLSYTVTLSLDRTYAFTNVYVEMSTANNFPAIATRINTGTVNATQTTFVTTFSFPFLYRDSLTRYFRARVRAADGVTYSVYSLIFVKP